ncbi:putative RNA polymerase II subunit B1 CTD phosphatase RPAP2 isoform X2 [Clavelina lepadiformis]|uniref:putative RNA polymerase II subunit B1 CTD phosphatase RPAP2 isoform X2 n=1 Tax=Clavelina lepadiformis TaxID=159417 RepID=UPI00404188A2
MKLCNNCSKRRYQKASSQLLLVYFLTVEHYQDVVEERAILNMCGYPMCDNKLENVPRQQYKISGNKVYDLTQRKNFCSNLCYRLSSHVQNQILTSPLWLRDPEKITPITLETSGVGLQGDRVILRHVAVDTNTHIQHCESNQGGNDIDESDNREVRFAEESYSDSANHASHPLPKSSSASSTKSSTQRKILSLAQQKAQLELMFKKLLSVLQEWITKESLIYLKYCSWNVDEEKCTNTCDVTKKNIEISEEERRKRNKIRLLEERLHRVVVGNSPAAGKQEESKAGELEAVHIFSERVERFYGGQLEYREQTSRKIPKHSENADKGAVFMRPPVDSVNQAVIRRKILHQKISKVMHDILPTLPSTVLSHDLKELIASFRLSSNNIVLKTNEYPIMAIVLLQLMSKSNLDVKQALGANSTVINHMLKLFTLSLKSVEQALDALIHELI